MRRNEKAIIAAQPTNDTDQIRRTLIDARE
jgi:hypothetical protein